MPKLLPTSSTALVRASSILTIFAASEYLDADESAGVFNTTPTSSREVVDKTLDFTNYIFIRHLKAGWMGILEADADPLALETMGPEPKLFLPAGLKYLEEYAVENVHQETFLIAKEVKVQPDEQGRTQVAYNVQDLRGHVIFTTDGYETRCGIQVILKGRHEVVRGKISSDGWFCYVVKDFLTGNHYEIKFPKWMTFCACLAFWKHPTLQMRKLEEGYDSVSEFENRHHIPGETVALMGKKKWKGTLYQDKVQFGIKFMKSCTMDKDTKLFIFSAGLVLFHIYFRSTSRELRCLRNYTFVIVLFGVFLACVLILTLSFN